MQPGRFLGGWRGATAAVASILGVVTYPNKALAEMDETVITRAASPEVVTSFVGHYNPIIRDFLIKNPNGVSTSLGNQGENFPQPSSVIVPKHKLSDQVFKFSPPRVMLDVGEGKKEYKPELSFDVKAGAILRGTCFLKPERGETYGVEIKLVNGSYVSYQVGDDSNSQGRFYPNQILAACIVQPTS